MVSITHAEWSAFVEALALMCVLGSVLGAMAWGALCTLGSYIVRVRFDKPDTPAQLLSKAAHLRRVADRLTHRAQRLGGPIAPPV